MNNDCFQGATNYSIQIYVKGKIIQHIEKVIIKVQALDHTPNYSVITNNLLLVFFIVVIIIIAANKSTDILHYLLAIIVFFLAFLFLKIKIKVSNLFKSSLKD